jgi:phytol kinase
MNNWLGFLIAIVYIFAIVGVGEGLRRWRGYSSDFTRKVIHIGVGMLSWALPLLFDNPWPFVFAAATFMVINFLDWRYGFVAAMASGDQSNLGTVYFPLAAAVVAVIFWDQPPLMVAALMPLTWGDGMAPVFGRAFGKNHTYSVLGNTRSLQGSAAFFVMGSLFTWLALWMLNGSPGITAVEAVLPALVIVGVATLAEAVSGWGLDNLTVTASAVLILLIWPF